MPLFEFACRACGHRFETLVTGGREAACPHCHATDLEKLYSSFATRSSGGHDARAAAPRFT